jgi:hypothetical protein
MEVSFFLRKKKNNHIYTFQECLDILAQDAVNSNSAVATTHHQEQTITQSTIATPVATSNVSMNQTSGGIQATGSFHSVSSVGSAAEMSKYFPDAQTPSSSPYR